MELTRKQVIEELQKMLDYCSIRQDSTPERKQALVYAISSLKTDEAYQIMYEGGEIFTKADMIATLKDLQSEIEKMQSVPCDYHGDWCVDRDKVWKIIQQKIDAL